MFAQDDSDLLDKLKKFRADQEIKVKEMKLKED